MKSPVIQKEGIGISAGVAPLLSDVVLAKCDRQNGKELQEIDNVNVLSCFDGNPIIHDSKAAFRISNIRDIFADASHMEVKIEEPKESRVRFLNL